MTSRFFLRNLCLATALLSTGCAASHTALQIGKADRAVDNAKERGAPEHAVYEYTMAKHYLKKAREEANYSDFKDSVALARGAAEWADKAIIIMEKEGRGLDPDALPGETRTLTEEDKLSPEPKGVLPPEDDDLPEKPDEDEAPATPVENGLPDAPEPSLPKPEDTPEPSGEVPQ